MTRQRFNTADVLRLEVAEDPPPGQLLNLLPNPDGERGGYGWVSPIPNTSINGVTGPFSGHATALEVRTTVTQAVHITSEPVPVIVGHYVGVWVTEITLSAGVGGWMLKIEYLNDAGVVIATHTATAPRNARLTNQLVPAGATSARLRLDLYTNSAGTGNPVAGSLFRFADAIFATDATTSSALTLLFFSPQTWVDILGPTHEITVERAELNLGTLAAAINDSSLDPSQGETLRKGKQVRLILDGSDEPLFTGEILNAKATYDPIHPNAAKRTRIQLTAVDQAQPLSNTTRADGVASIDELRTVLEGCRVPWNVNGDTGQTADVPVVVARNESASAMDQVAITRDSNHGYAWFSRAGVVQVWDAAALTAAAGTPVAMLDEDAYNADGLSIDYDSDRCINHVTLKYLRIDPVTGETEEVTYGPYTDDSSRVKWGTHAGEFTVQGITEDAATLTAYAAAILTANATPAVRLNEATVPLNTTADVAAWALLDLYDLVTLANTNAGINEESRITRLSHRIEGGKWTVTYGFTTDGGVAQPQVTPSPTPSGGKTLSELLRPVGEVTMWYGAAADTPAGWLLCNGAAFSATDYPELAALLGGTNTPNMVDVFPIGAGTKAKGTNGGDPTKVIGAANLPPHAHTTPAHNHPYDVSTTAGTSGATIMRGTATVAANIAGAYNPANAGGGNTGNGPGASTPLDVMPPWRALYFIIRAR